MASTDALPVPRKNVAYRATFPIYDNTGSLVTGAAGLDSEVSKDAGTFADCTNEATEIATSSGLYTLDLTATEMNADTVAVIVKTSTTNAKTSVLVFYPQESGDIKVDVQSWLTVAPNALTSGRVDAIVGAYASGQAPLQPTVAARTLDVSAGGEAGVDWANVGSPTTTVDLSGTTIKTTQKVDVDTIKTNPVVNGGTLTFPTTATLASTTNITAGTVTTATNVTTVNGLAANVITATSIAADAITDAKVAADVTIASVTGAVGSVTGAVGSVTGAVGSVTAGVTLTNAGIDAVLDRSAGVETSFTLRQALRLILATAVGKLSGAATTTVTIRDINDAKNRVVATVDASGNRSAVTTDVT